MSGDEDGAFAFGLVDGAVAGALGVVALIACLGLRAEYTTIDKRIDEVAADTRAIRARVEAPPSAGAAPICVTPEASP